MPGKDELHRAALRADHEIDAARVAVHALLELADNENQQDDGGDAEREQDQAQHRVQRPRAQVARRERRQVQSSSLSRNLPFTRASCVATTSVAPWRAGLLREQIDHSGARQRRRGWRSARRRAAASGGSPPRARSRRAAARPATARSAAAPPCRPRRALRACRAMRASSCGTCARYWARRRLSRTLRCLTRCSACSTMPTVVARQRSSLPPSRRPRFSPETSTSPSLARIRPARTCSSVVLPQPEGPSTSQRSPCATFHSARRSASCSP